MTGPSAVTVSLMDGAWKEVKRLPLGPSLSDTWWRFGGLIEVKVSSNRTKFPVVITKKIKGIAMWYEGTSKAFPPQPRYKTEEESDALPIPRKTGTFFLGPLQSRNRQGSPTAHSVREHLEGSPQPRPLTKWKHHLCNCFGALCCVPLAMTGEWLGMADRHPHWCRKTYEIISSNVFSPFTIWKPESWLFIFFFNLSKFVTCVQLHVRYVWSICNENRGLNTTSHFMQWIP